MISDGQMFAAEVVNNMDGTLTATYTSDFPGQYFVYIEEIDMSRSRLQRARYFKGSPYNLTISGDVTLDVDNLPSCNEVDASGYDDFWRLGTWLSSREASAEHGTLRNGWVFQPKQCVHETYSYDDLMVLAALEEPTWIVILGERSPLVVPHDEFGRAMRAGVGKRSWDPVLLAITPNHSGVNLDQRSKRRNFRAICVINSYNFGFQAMHEILQSVPCPR